MTHSTRLKICGVTDPHQAAALAKLGVDYIGLIFNPASPRSVNVDHARVVARCTQEAGAQTVAVFVDHDAQQMQNIIENISVSMIQLHGDTSKATHHHLAIALPRLFAISFKNPIPSYSQLITEFHLQPSRDFLLFDSIQLADNLREQLAPFRAFRFFLAGRIDVANIQFYRDHYQPYAIDVASGVESAPGIKDLDLVQTVLTQLASRHALTATADTELPRQNLLLDNALSTQPFDEEPR